MGGGGVVWRFYFKAHPGCLQEYGYEVSPAYGMYRTSVSNIF